MIKIGLMVLLWMLICLVYLLVGAMIAYVLRPDNAIASMVIICLWPIIAPIVLIINISRKVFKL